MIGFLEDGSGLGWEVLISSIHARRPEQPAKHAGYRGGRSIDPRFLFSNVIKVVIFREIAFFQIYEFQLALRGQFFLEIHV